MDSAQAIPILPSPDISLTKEFYRTELGFDVIQPEMDQYVMLRRAICFVSAVRPTKPDMLGTARSNGIALTLCFQAIPDGKPPLFLELL